jgi:hypothetical protein
VNSFLALLDGEADQLCVAERAEHSGTAEPIGEPTQRLRECTKGLQGQAHPNTAPGNKM